ncbi:MAG: preprotein translocase subunit SecG [Betaproteobacteria bacterium]|nr:preprotein translocase subunit SecG [Betaproteobacteria bacterium]
MGLETVIWIIHVLAAGGVIGLVLLQHGKGADMGAAFGSGSSGSLFGATGSANFLSRTTAVLAVVFFVTSLGLTYISSHKTENKGVMERQVPAAAKPAAPAEVAPLVPAPVPAGDTGSKAKDIPK